MPHGTLGQEKVKDSYVKMFDDDLSVEGESPLIVLVPSVLQLSSSITPTRSENVF